MLGIGRLRCSRLALFPPLFRRQRDWVAVTQAVVALPPLVYSEAIR